MRHRIKLIIWGIAVAAFVLLPVIAGLAQPPQPGLSLPCKVVEVYDGDTVTVEVTVRARVRLIDCWAPELREPGGKESRDHLANHALHKSGTLYVPTGDAKHAGQVFSFDRLVGRVWIGDEQVDLSQRMVADGKATKDRN
jgi:endonuclease YncB( thermonuclease family)